VDISRLIKRILTKELALKQKAAHFTDIRQNPDIPLKNIIFSFCLMPILGIDSMLKYDQQWSRDPQFKRLFGKEVEKRKMVTSDTSLQRAVRWIKPQEARRFLESFLPEYRQSRSWARPLVPGGRARKIGIIDGSIMSNHYLVALELYGTVVYPIRLVACAGRGYELTEAKTLIETLPASLGTSCPDLLLFDGLYVATTLFESVLNNGMHLLVKCRDPEFRTIFKDAKFFFDSGALADTKVIRHEGYDENRLCSWRMEKTSDTFAGYPVLVAHLVEDYAKDKKNPHRESWIVTSDCSLSWEEIREAAHARWSIENDVFKKLSGLTATKRFRLKDTKAFITMLMLFCAAVAAFELTLQILAHHPKVYKDFLQGMKVTKAGVFMRMAKCLCSCIFR
jgi:hypothetical protein